MATLNDVFATQDNVLDKVIILPFRGGDGTYGKYLDGTYNLPAGYTWTDFEYVEFTSVTNATDSLMGSQNVPKEIFVADPSWQAQLGFNDAGLNYQTYIYSEGSATSFRLDNTNDSLDSVGLGMVVGYTRRFATRNASAIINVDSTTSTGGTFTGSPEEVVQGQHYTIDIRSVLGDDYVGKHLIVQAEILNNSGFGIADWFKVDWSGDITFTYGADATVMGDKIMVTTGNDGLWRSIVNPDVPNTGVTTGISNTRCRILVWKIDYPVSNTAGPGGAGKTTLYDGDKVTAGNPIGLNDSITNYDMLYVKGSFISSAQEFAITGMVDPDDIRSGDPATNVYFACRAAGSSDASLGFDHDPMASSTLTVRGDDTTWTDVGVTKVVGINYS